MRKRASIASVCEVNPRIPTQLRQKTTVPISFLPMASVLESGTISDVSERELGDVQKGYRYFEEGDVLVAKITPCMENGKAALAADLPHRVGFGSTEFHVLRPGDDVDGRYLFRMIWNPMFRHAAEKRMTGSAGQRRVPSSFFEQFKIPLPPLPEQRRIAAILDKGDAARRKRQQTLDLADQFLRSAFLDLFGDPVTNPKGWPVVKLQKLIDPERPITYGILKPGPDLPEGVPYVRVVDIANEEVDVSALKRTSVEIAEQYRRSKLRQGDVLLSIRGHVGRLAIVPEVLEAANITQDTARLAASSDVLPEYLLGALSTSGLQQWMARHVKGGAVKGINLGDVKKLPIALPPSGDQERFARSYRAMRDVRALEVSLIRGLDDVRGSLTQRAFRGDL